MKTFLIAVLLIICTNSFAQLATYDWSNRIGTTSTAKKSLIDGSGNIYVWVTAVAPITIGSTTYTNTAYDNYLVKYNNAGNIIWSKEIRIRMFNMCLTKDSSSVLVCGFLQSNYTSFDLGNSVTTGIAYYSSGIIYKVDGSNGNSLWVKAYDPTLPALSTAVRVDAIYETNKGIFCTQGLKVRRLDVDGNEIWNKTIGFNGTAYTLESKNFNSWADDNGNTFFTGVSDNGNTTILTINGVNYTTIGTNNVCRTFFSLDSSGNTNWVKPNVNFQPGKLVEVSKAGDVFVLGSYIYNGMGGYTNHPFIPNYCNRDYNIFKADLKTGKLIWQSYSIIQTNAHLSNDGNLYVLATKQSAGIDFTVGTTTRNHNTIASTNYLYSVRINNAGVPDSVFTIATLANNATIGILNFYRNNQGKFVCLFNRNNIAISFNNGNANLNTVTASYQGLVQFTAPNLPARHTTTWTGTTNGNWFTLTNWSNGIPSDSSNVIIPAGATFYPTTESNYYNFTTSKYAKCGYLKVDAGVDILLGYAVVVDGILNNEGSLTYLYNFSGQAGNYSIWSSNNTTNGYIIGNGTITFKAIDGMYYNFVRSGNNKIVINLLQPNHTIYFTDCKAAKNVTLQNGNCDFSQTTTQYFYVDSSIQFTPPARFLNGTITQKAKPNISVQFPLGTATNLQPASVTLFNTTRDNYLTASFTNTINGNAPNPANCIVNGQGIASVLNGGFWTINAATPLINGEFYNANFKLKGSTNTSAANRYALLKRNNSSSNWEVAGTYEPAKDSASYVVSSASNITSFSDFAIGIANGVLPIHSIKLSVIKNNNTNKLSWNIVATDGDKIVIEKSTNAINFSALYSSAFFASGTYNDVVSIGKTYYRLKVSDKNGNTSYSNVVVIDDKEKIVIQVYPTIVQSTFTVQNNSNINLTMVILSVEGKLVMQKQIGIGTNIISAENFSHQTYFYQIINQEAVISSGLFVKQ